MSEWSDQDTRASPSDDGAASISSTQHEDTFPSPRSSAQSDASGFVFKYGIRHHGFDPKKVPYPLSLDRLALDADTATACFLQAIRQDVSAVRFEGGTSPAHCLDVGCGTGSWILNAAPVWTHTQFTGFDLCTIQPDLSLLAPDLADRVTWVHGNFLERWPFEDSSFEHVFIRSIAKGVPEHLWEHIFDEVARVLIPGGSVEVYEEDIIFPRVPYNEEPPAPRPVLFPEPPSRSRHSSRSSLSSLSSTALSIASIATDSGFDQDLLESLYFGVFKERNINITPTRMIPSYMNISLKNTVAAPAISLPVPPPFQPPEFPPQSPPPPETTPPSAASDGKESLSSLKFSDLPESPRDSSHRRGSRSSHGGFSSSVTGGECDSEEVYRLQLYVIGHDSNANHGGEKLGQTVEPRIVTQVSSKVGPRTLAFNLRIAANWVLTCKEAMWEEMVRRQGWKRSEMRNNVVADTRASFERAFDAYAAQIRRHLGPDVTLAESPFPFYSPPSQPQQPTPPILTPVQRVSSEHLLEEDDDISAAHSAVDPSEYPSSTISTGDPPTPYTGTSTADGGGPEEDGILITETDGVQFSKSSRTLRLCCGFKANVDPSTMLSAKRSTMGGLGMGTGGWKNVSESFNNLSATTSERELRTAGVGTSYDETHGAGSPDGQLNGNGARRRADTQ